MSFTLKELAKDGKCFFIKVTILDGETEDFGPFDLYDLQRLKSEKRIDGSVFIYHSNFDNWKILADFSDYEEVFQEAPPEVTSYQRRVMARKELLADALMMSKTNRFSIKTQDISMMALKIVYNNIDYEFNLEEIFDIQIDHPKFREQTFQVQVLRLFDSTGFDSLLTLKFLNLTKEHRNIISDYVHF